MNCMHPTNYFRLFVVTLFGVQLLFGSSAFALSALQGDAETTIQFDRESSTLSEVSKASLGIHLACMETIALSAVIVVAYGDAEIFSKADQLRISASRAAEIRAYFLSAGVPDGKIYTQALVVSHENPDSGTLSGTAVVATNGYCRSTVSGKDCRILCRRSQ